MLSQFFVQIGFDVKVGRYKGWVGRIPRKEKAPGIFVILVVDKIDGSVCFCLGSIQTYTHFSVAAVDRMISIGIVVSAIYPHEPFIIKPQSHGMTGIKTDLLPHMPFPNISTSITRIPKRPPDMCVLTQIRVAVIRGHTGVMSV